MLATVRQLVRQLVEEVEPCDQLEAEHLLDVIAWLAGDDEIFRITKPATPPKHLVSYCALVDSRFEQILLVHHRDAERWLPTGGHVDVDEHPADAAAREIQEELGIEANFHEAVGAKPLMVTVTRTVGRSTSHVDVSLWFVFAGSERVVLSPDDAEFSETRWWSFDEVRGDGRIEFDPHLARFVDKLRLALG